MKFPAKQPIQGDVVHGDCLEIMPFLRDQSIDMILCDLPYGTTACKWDTIIPFDLLWKEYKRIIKPKGAVVLTASQPFTTILIHSNLKGFKYEWIWEKSTGSNFATVKYMPMKEHENILIFGEKRINYYPIKQERVGSRKGKKTLSQDSGRKNSVYGTQKAYKETTLEILRFPRSIQRFKNERGLHPTQKPVALFEYLIKTYTQPGQWVLDNCAGSGTTGIACINTNRNYILIEKDMDDKGNSLGYIDIINSRILKAKAKTFFGSR